MKLGLALGRIPEDVKLYVLIVELKNYVQFPSERKFDAILMR